MNKQTLIVSHDTGGAQVLSSWVANNNQYNYCFLLDGPAKTVFEKRLPSFSNNLLQNLDPLISASDFVLTSTSWSSDLERNAIQAAKRQGIEVASYLDHWINYKERFFIGDNLVLPDEIWVGDFHADAIAKQCFPDSKIRYKENQYFSDISKEYAKIQKKYPDDHEGLSLLFLTQPIDEANKFLEKNGSTFRFTSYELFRSFIEAVCNLNKKKGVKELVIRVHPNDSISQYRNWAQGISDISIRISEQANLIDDCVHSHWVIGAFSMGLVIALITERKVFSCLPEGVSSPLPHKEILPFQSYIQELQ